MIFPKQRLVSGIFFHLKYKFLSFSFISAWRCMFLIFIGICSVLFLPVLKSSWSGNSISIVSLFPLFIIISIFQFYIVFLRISSLKILTVYSRLSNLFYLWQNLPIIHIHAVTYAFLQLCESIKSFVRSWEILQLYLVASISFQTFFVQSFKIVIEFWKFSMLLLYILWDDWRIFMISGLNKQLQQELEYTLLKFGREEERYAIKLCFKLGKMPQKCMECFRLHLERLAWIEHQFLSGIRDSRKAGSVWGMMRGVGGVRKSIHQSWLAKG